MTLYNVHLYREMRLRFDGIEADTAESAADQAKDMRLSDADAFDECEGETLSALIDVVGDEDFRQSVTLDFETERQRKAAAKLRAALQGVIAYAENEAYSLSHHKDSPEAQAEGAKAWEAVEAAQAVLAEANASGIVPPSPEIDIPSHLTRNNAVISNLLAALIGLLDHFGDAKSDEEIRLFNNARVAIARANASGMTPPSSNIDIHAYLAEWREIADIWCTNDVKSVRPDLTDEQCWEVLEFARRKHDASIGINWDVLECHAEMLFGNAPETGEAEQA